MQYDVIIIGAGITGTMTAYKLAKYHLKTLVVEAGTDIASATTKANSAIVHAGFDALPGTLKARLNVSGCAQMPELAKKLDVDYERCGSLVCAFDDADVRMLGELMERGAKNGVPDLEIISGDALFGLEPRLSRDAKAALWAPTAGIVCPWGLAIACAECAAVNGFDFRFGFRVSGMAYCDGSLIISDGRECICSRYVVNAAGLHSDEIVPDDIFVNGEEVRIIPRRGEYLLLDKTEEQTARHTLFSTPSAAGKGILVSPTVHGNVIVGPNAHEVDDRSDTATTADGMAEVASGAKKLVPDINLRSSITSFAGVRATPSTGDFAIVPSKKYPHNLLHAAGIESPGLASSPAVADFIVEKLGEMGLELNPNPSFRDSRPEQIRFSRLSDSEKTRLIRENPAYGRIVCRCEGITEGEIADAINRPVGAVDLDGVKRRVRAGMGRCQGGFCSPRVVSIIARELKCGIRSVTKRGPGSEILK